MDYPKLAYATFVLSRELDARREMVIALHESARGQVDSGQLDDAEESYKDLLRLDMRNATAWFEVSLLYLQRERVEEALSAVMRSIELDPSVAKHHYALGSILAKLNEPIDALVKYMQIMNLSEGLERSAHQQSLPAGSSISPLAVAADALRRTLVDQVDDEEGYRHLGHILMTLHMVGEAAIVYQKARSLMPKSIGSAENLADALHYLGNNSRAYILLGHAYSQAGRYAEAITQFERGLAGSEGEAEDYSQLADALRHLQRFRQVIDVCRRATERFPTSIALYRSWVWSLVEIGESQEAIHVATLASERLGDPLILACERNLTLPTIYRSPQEIELRRTSFEQGLRRLSEEVGAANTDDCARLRNCVPTNFYLGYQGLNDVELQRESGVLSSRIMGTCFPAWDESRDLLPKTNRDRIRVGYFSSYMRWHAVSWMFLGWLTDHDSSRFEVHSYYVGKVTDLTTKQFETCSHRFHHLPRNAEVVCRQIVNDDLDILVFLDVGMDSFTSQIANLRLAPIQCAAWGHPVTTGLPTIDYFISSELAEPEDAESHYTEQLVRLPHIGANVQSPYLPVSGSERHDTELPGDRVIYLSPHSPFKYLPQYDFVFPAIAARAPQALFVFVEGPVPEKAGLFRRRLAREFERAGLDIDGYASFLPQMAYYDFLALNRACDVFIDAFDWSGGLTTLDAISCSLPIVTRPGKLMRGRQTFAALTRLGLTETIASTTEGYVEIAVKLGLDANWRSQISELMTERRGLLFGDRECVSALEAFYTRAVEERTRPKTRAVSATKQPRESAN